MRAVNPGGRHSQTVVDGRSARRERNISAVLEAEWALLREGQGNPSWEAVAARAGVSLRSVQRYFPDREELILAAMRAQHDQDEPLHHLDRVGQGDLADRIERFVAHRARVHEVFAPTARVAEAAAGLMPVLLDAVRETRVRLRATVDVHFATELEPLDPRQRGQVGDTLDLLCQPESLETLRVARGLGPDRSHTLLVTAVTLVLGAATVPAT